MAFASVMVTVGCGADGGGDEDERPGLVTEGKAPDTPYGGPLWVTPASAGAEGDGEGPEAIRARAGAASRALECEGAIHQGGRSGGWSPGDAGDTPEEGLAAFFDIDHPSLPAHGYRVEREEAERVLYSFDVDGRTKAAVVVAKDRPNSPGWGPETSASCDPVELPPGFAESLGYDVWTDEHGERVPISELTSMAGTDHCGWQDARLLQVGGETNGTIYARDPEGVVEPEMLTAPFDGDATMPGDARDTGYRHGDRGWQLWLSPDPSTAFVRTPEGVEAWPAVNERFTCE